MKYDICLMNPPFARAGNNIHLKFTDRINDICNKQVSIFPISLVKNHGIKSQDVYKEKLSKYLSEVEEVPSSLFTGTSMQNCGIYVFNKDKTENNISVKTLNSDIKNVKSLLDISEFTNYELEFIKYLEEQGSQDILGYCGRLDNWKAQVQGLNDKKEKLTELVNRSLRNLKKYYENHKKYYGLIINMINGGINGSALSSKNGQIFNNYDDFVKLFVDRPIGTGYNILMFKSKTEAENCKEALKRPLLRFTLYRTQYGNRMLPNRVYRYIPAIDWSDDKVKTDEGLLEVCGCPKDKCKEYAEYCKKIINEVDRKR